ncbi:MAG: phenylalanine 4-monooxygenase [Deltaproteobacteria bacterium]|nr:phenylalanine 4-monooxygenase [Deltaproteobacteria bacterium]
MVDKALLNHPLLTTEDEAVYTPEDHETWSILYNKLRNLLPQYAAPEVLSGMDKLNITKHEIPNFDSLNKVLKRETNFSVTPVKGLIPHEPFFALLANRCFPTSCFIRKREQLEYLVEPDVFHDIFGHIPLLVHPVFADFMQEFGKQGLESIKHGINDQFAALYWFTVEFGLIHTRQGLRIYGAGITSSIAETIYSIDSEIPNRLAFDMIRAMKTEYEIHHMQKSYFVIRDYQELFDTIKQINWDMLKENLQSRSFIPEGKVLTEQERFTA